MSASERIVTTNQGRVLIGAGTGRSGSLSLARLLARQPGASISHEFRPVGPGGSLGEQLRPPLPWVFDRESLRDAVNALTRIGDHDGRLVGDVGFYWAPYVPDFVALFGNRLRVVILERDRGEVVESFERKVGHKNHWIDHDGSLWQLSPGMDAAFPHFEESDRAAAIGRYWDLYHELSRRYAEEYPESVRVWHFSALNDPSRIREILEFVGVGVGEMVIPRVVWENRSRRSVRSVVHVVRQRLGRL